MLLCVLRMGRMGVSLSCFSVPHGGSRSLSLSLTVGVGWVGLSCFPLCFAGGGGSLLHLSVPYASLCVLLMWVGPLLFCFMRGRLGRSFLLLSVSCGEARSLLFVCVWRCQCSESLILTIHSARWRNNTERSIPPLEGLPNTFGGPHMPQGALPKAFGGPQRPCGVMKNKSS